MLPKQPKTQVNTDHALATKTSVVPLQTRPSIPAGALGEDATGADGGKPVCVYKGYRIAPSDDSVKIELADGRAADFPVTTVDSIENYLFEFQAYPGHEKLYAAQALVFDMKKKELYHVIMGHRGVTPYRDQASIANSPWLEQLFPADSKLPPLPFAPLIRKH